MKHLLYFALAILFSACVRIPAAPTMATEAEYYKQMYSQAAASAEAANALSLSLFATVITVVLAILAFQFLFNIRLNKADIESIENKMRAEIAIAQAAQLGALSTLDAANRLAFETRVQVIENQLRIDIKATINDLLKAQERAIKFIEAEMKTLRLGGDRNLLGYLDLADSFSPEEPIDRKILYKLDAALRETSSLERKNYERVEKIMPQMEAALGSFFGSLRKKVDAISLYDMIPNPDDKRGSIAYYYKNEPLGHVNPDSSPDSM